jgi:hypothetical protein
MMGCCLQSDCILDDGHIELWGAGEPVLSKTAGVFFKRLNDGLRRPRPHPGIYPDDGVR